METLTVKEVQEILNVSRPTLLDWRNKGILKAIKIGRTVRYDKKEVEKILRGE